MKIELRYYAQMYVGFEVFSKDENWLMPSNMCAIVLGEIDSLLEFKHQKEKYYSGKTLTQDR